MSTQPQFDRLTWSFEETCVELGISPATGERLLRRGDFPPIVRIGHKRFCRPEDAKSWLAKKAASWHPCKPSAAAAGDCRL
jgi:predicted DNA-binding transcriptional regulator AlpA